MTSSVATTSLFLTSPQIQERAKKEAAAKEREWLGKPPLPNKAGKKRSAATLAAPTAAIPSGVMTSSAASTDSPSARQPQTKRVRLNPVPPVIESPGETDGGSPPYSDGTSSPIDVTGGGPDSPGSPSSSPAPSGIAAFTAAAAAASAASAAAPASGNVAGAGNSGVSSFVSVLGPPPPVDASAMTRRGRPMESSVNSASPREGNGNIGIASTTAGIFGGNSGNGNSGGSGSAGSGGNSNNGSGTTGVSVSGGAVVSGGGTTVTSSGSGASTTGKGSRSSRAHAKPSTRPSRQPHKAAAAAAAVPSSTSSSSSTITTPSASTSASNRHSGNGGSAGSGGKGRGTAGACGGSNGGGVGAGGGGAHHYNQHQNNHNHNHQQHHVSTRSKRPRGGDADGGGRIGRAHPAPAPALSPPPTPAYYANASHALAKLGIPVALPGGGKGAVPQQLHLQQTVQQLQATQHLTSQQRSVSSGGNGSAVVTKRSPTVASTGGASGSLPPPCFMCGEDVTHWGLNAGNGEAVKCAHAGCERVFHVTCVAHLLRDAAVRTPGGSGAAAGTWECPIHRCARCGADENGLQLGESNSRGSRGVESVNGGSRGYWGKGGGGGAAGRSRRLWQCTWCSVAFCMSHLPPQLATAGRKARVADANQCVHCRSPSPR